MGTDIHLYVERQTASGAWETCDKWAADGDVDYDDRFYTGRSYDLFAMLANVRNGSGFAGVKTGEGFVPIMEPRGWPEDCCAELRAVEIEHTPGWLTLAELMNYDWTQTTQKQGWVRLQDWARWRITGKPHEWSGDIVGGDIRKLPVKQVDEAWSRHGKEGLLPYDLLWEKDEGAFETALGGPKVVTLVTWGVHYYESAADFLSHTLPRLWRLGRPEHVRIVFYFDS